MPIACTRTPHNAAGEKLGQTRRDPRPRCRRPPAANAESDAGGANRVLLAPAQEVSLSWSDRAVEAPAGPVSWSTFGSGVGPTSGVLGLGGGGAAVC
jgi:hypothetical protein